MKRLVDDLAKRFYSLRFLVLIVLYIALIVASSQTAFWLRFDDGIPPEQQPIDTELLPILITTRLVVFFALRLHKGVWRYAGVWELRNIVVGVTLSSLLFWLIVRVGLGITLYPRSVFIIDAVVLVCLMGGVRLAHRLYATTLAPAGNRRILIFGAGDAGELIARDMLRDPHSNTTPVGFIDDDHRKIGQVIHGIPVLGDRSRLSKIIDSQHPDELLIAIPSAGREALRAIIRQLDGHQIKITTLPRLRELRGDPDVRQIRELKLEDLLARDVIGLDYAPVKEFISNKRVLITGAGGSIGAELCRQVAAAGPLLLLLGERHENSLFHIHNELCERHPDVALMPYILDVTDEKRLKQIFEQHRPEVVFHAAAHKHVPLMEANACEAVKNNVYGTRLVAEAAAISGTSRFVLISTDKAVNPSSVMGATKRVAELIIEQMGRLMPNRFTTVRFGNVLGSNGSVVPTFVSQIARGGPVTVTHPEMTRFFMLIPEAVQLVLHAAALRDPAPLFVLEMGEQVRVVDMARDLIRLAGFVPDRDIEIQFTGLRPGEKLFEEIASSQELVTPSPIPKLLKVQPNTSRSLSGLDEAVASLEAIAARGDFDGTIEELRRFHLRFDQFSGNTQSVPQ